MENIVVDVAKQSPLLAVAILALLVVFRLAEQKVAMAQRQAEREKEVATQCLMESKDSQAREETLISVIRENMTTMTKLVAAIDNLTTAVNKSTVKPRVTKARTA